MGLKNIVIIEDDIKLCELMKNILESSGHNVYIVDDFINVIQEVSKLDVDLILLDINLPYFDGYYICREIRRTSNIPIIIISARSNEKEQILAIDLGADDYITKPFKLDLLNSKIKAVLRRAYGEYSSAINRSTEVHGIVLDEYNFKIIYNGESIELSKNELKLIKKFLDNPNKIIKRVQLFNELWDDSSFVDENTLTVNITRIKNIFKSFGITNVIKTKKGVGYIFDTDEI